MSSNAFSGVGTVFARDTTPDSSGTAYVDLAEVNSISGPDMTRATIDVTSLDSTDGYEEFIASFRNAGKISLNMNFTATTFNMLVADFESDDLVSYRITLSDSSATTIVFNGLVTGLSVAIPAKDKVSSDVVIKITGKPVIA